MIVWIFDSILYFNGGGFRSSNFLFVIKFLVLAIVWEIRKPFFEMLKLGFGAICQVADRNTNFNAPPWHRLYRQQRRRERDLARGFGPRRTGREDQHVPAASTASSSIAPAPKAAPAANALVEVVVNKVRPKFSGIANGRAPHCTADGLPISDSGHRSRLSAHYHNS